MNGGGGRKRRAREHRKIGKTPTETQFKLKSGEEDVRVATTRDTFLPSPPVLFVFFFSFYRHCRVYNVKIYTCTSTWRTQSAGKCGRRYRTVCSSTHANYFLTLKGAPPPPCRSVAVEEGSMELWKMRQQF